MKRIFVACIALLTTHANEKVVLDHDEYCKNLKSTLEHFKQLCLSSDCFSPTSPSLKQRTLCTVYKTGTVLSSQLFFHACRHQVQ